ncbi:MAG TPA: V-type ATP synthase subunit E family protein [Burkholderiales bacterium]|nr:V-type ATP synthase subunit E family protein [Burkholderiales bacterium]
MSRQTTRIEDLEAALIYRAEVLADEYLNGAERARGQIVEEANKTLRLREEREILAAKARGERLYRQKVQASEIRMQEELDHLRWTLVQSVLEDVTTRLAQVTEDDALYLPLLRRYLARGARSIERDDLVARVAARDLARLAPRWADFVKEAAPGKRVVLSQQPLDTLGGILLESADGRIRVDNTFEGRIERLQGEVHRAVSERLFASAEHMGALFNG